MKCTCDRAALAEALAATGSVAASRTPKPILQCVRLSAEKELLTLTAYDLEVGLRYRVQQVDVGKTGEALVGADRLRAIVQESSDETMSLELQAEHLHVRGADSHFQIVCQNVKDFPPVPELEKDPDFTVKAGALRSAIDRTVFAAARENTRYAINGVLWERQGKQLQLAATDGRRLALASASLEKSTGDDAQAIVPSKTLALLCKMHFDADELLKVKLLPNQVLVQSERCTISSVLVEGHFPKYQDVIPRDLDKKATMDTAEFLSAVRRAALLANAESKGIRMHMIEKGVVLSSRTPEQGEATIKLGCEYSGPELTIGFNPEYLADALKVCGESVTFEVKEPSKPGILRSGPAFQYVVMPVNLS